MLKIITKTKLSPQKWRQSRERLVRGKKPGTLHIESEDHISRTTSRERDRIMSRFKPGSKHVRRMINLFINK